MPLHQEDSKTFFGASNGTWFNPQVERLRQIGLAKEDYGPEKMQVIVFQMTTKASFFDKNAI